MKAGHVQVIAKWVEKYGPVVRIALGEREAVRHIAPLTYCNDASEYLYYRSSLTATLPWLKPLSLKVLPSSLGPLSNCSTATLPRLVSGPLEVSDLHLHFHYSLTSWFQHHRIVTVSHARVRRCLYILHLAFCPCDFSCLLSAG